MTSNNNNNNIMLHDNKNNDTCDQELHFDDIYLNLDQPESTLKKDIKTLLKTLFKCEDEFCDDEEIVKLKALTGGITNKLYKVKTPHKYILVRINGMGTENLVDRHKETQYMKLLSRFEQGPKVFCTFSNGLVYDFIPGRNLTADELEENCEKIAVRMAKFHSIPTGTTSPSPKHRSNIMHMAKQWIKEAKRLMQSNDVPISKEEMNVDPMEQELLNIEHLAFKYHQEIVFCHNDIQPLNIIYDEESGDLRFIDYEYCGYNYRCFDIGNHFCEYSGMEVDIDKYPSVELQRRFIRAYLKEATIGDASDESLVEQLRVESNFFSLLANLAYGTWAIPQAKNSNIDFDYRSYGIRKYQYYWKYRDQFFQEFIDFHEQAEMKERESID